MAVEKSGFSIVVTCSQDPSIVFRCRAKKRPGVRLGEKIDMTTDSSSIHRDYEPAPLLEVTDGQLTVLDDPEVAAKILAVLGVKGTITFTGKTTETAVAFENAWFASYTPDDAGIDGDAPTATLLLQSSGTLPL